MELASELREFIYENLITLEVDVVIGDDDNIFQQGYVNSLFAVQLVAFIEDLAGFEIDNDDLEIENFNSISNMLTFINDKSSG